MRYILYPPLHLGGITGRDRHLISSALAYAITVIDNLPFRLREDNSNRDDMLTLLLALVPCPAELHETFAWTRVNMGVE